MTSATGVLVSPCFSAKAICSSVFLDFFMFQLLARRLQQAGKLSLKLDEKTGGTSNRRDGQMKRKQFTEEQIIGILKEAEAAPIVSIAVSIREGRTGLLTTTISAIPHFDKII